MTYAVHLHAVRSPIDPVWSSSRCHGPPQSRRWQSMFGVLRPTASAEIVRIAFDDVALAGAHQASGIRAAALPASARASFAPAQKLQCQ